MEYCTESTATTLSDYLGQEIAQLSTNSSATSLSDMKVLVSALSKCSLYSASIVIKCIPIFSRLIVDKITLATNGLSSIHESYPLDCVEFFK